MVKKLILTAFALLFVPPSLSEAESNYHAFTSAIYKFAVSYPKTWNRGEAVYPQTVIRVESPDGEDFNVTVIRNRYIRELSPNEYATMMHDNADVLVSSILSKNYPDVKLIRKGITTLSQQPAVFYEFDFTLSAIGRELPMRGFVVSTKYEDKQYTLTFRALQQYFAEYRPIIEIIALSFQLTKIDLK